MHAQDSVALCAMGKHRMFGHQKFGRRVARGDTAGVMLERRARAPRPPRSLLLRSRARGGRNLVYYLMASARLAAVASLFAGGFYYSQPLFNSSASEFGDAPFEEHLANVAWAITASYQFVSLLLLLMVASGAWSVLRSLAFAMASRAVVTYEMEDEELAHTLAWAVELGQLPNSRFLRLGRSRPEDDVLEQPKSAAPHRAIKLAALQPWRSSAGGNGAKSCAAGVGRVPQQHQPPTRLEGPLGAPEGGEIRGDSGEDASDVFELEVDRRFASRLCVWEPPAADDPLPASRDSSGANRSGVRTDRGGRGGGPRGHGQSGGGRITAGSVGGAFYQGLRLLLGLDDQRTTCRRVYFFVSPGSPQHFGGGRGGGDFSGVQAASSSAATPCVTLLRAQRQSLWPILEHGRTLWHGAREGQTVVKRLVRAPFFPGGESEPRRALSSFALPSDPSMRNAMLAVVDDYRDFVGRLRWYVQRGVPFGRGYLLLGPL